VDVLNEDLVMAAPRWRSSVDFIILPIIGKERWMQMANCNCTFQGDNGQCRLMEQIGHHTGA
jgi:hypothetical protein